MNNRIVLNTISEAHELLGLPKPQHPLVSVFHHCQMKDMESALGTNIVINLFQIACKHGMEGTMGYGRNSYDFTEGSLIFTKPGQVLTVTGHNVQPDSDGWTLAFHPDLIRKSPLAQTIDDYTFFSYDVTEALHLSDKEHNSIRNVVDKIHEETAANIDRHSQKLIVSNIELLLDYCSRFYDRQFFTRTNLNKDVITDFNSVIKEYFKSGQQMDLGLPSVKYCAGQLHLSPNYLSDLLKKETGKSAKDHINLFVVEKAKNQLLGTTERVSQIAYDLGFEYPQHFSKLFKSKTGMSPAEYRSVN